MPSLNTYNYPSKFRCVKTELISELSKTDMVYLNRAIDMTKNSRFDMTRRIGCCFKGREQ